MKITFPINRRGDAKTLSLNTWASVLLSLCVLGMPVGVGVYLGAQLGGTGLLLEQTIEDLEEELSQQREALAQGRSDAQQKIQALTLKLAELQARLVRLDALGERLVQMGDLDDGEFDFSAPTAVGGPEADDGQVATVTLEQLFDDLDRQVTSSEQQLGLLQTLIADRKLSAASTVAGKPVAGGWVSSHFGYRSDPFTGHRAWHKGVDIAGKTGTDVVAVAAGVVTRADNVTGYGNMVEIDHGEGYVTRYGHNKENKVKAGDLIEKGQVIAAMGSTGRSTGSHVHFEVYKNGRVVDPSSYIQRNIR